MCSLYGTNNLGLYGKTTGYYGTVELQGRLTLHLHMLLWIENSLTPQAIRDKILDPSSDFQKKMVEYLESVCTGEFLTGTMEQVQDFINTQQEFDPEQAVPNLRLPEPAPEQCNGNHIVAMSCDKLRFRRKHILYKRFGRALVTRNVHAFFSNFSNSFSRVSRFLRVARLKPLDSRCHYNFL
jgi:hypothetical protein